MPASLIQYRLRVRTVSTLANPDGASDAFVISSVPGDALPFIAAPPTGDGQEVDPITGAVRTGAYTLEIVDATTGTDGTGTIRALTSRLEDAQFRQQLLSRRAFLEIRTDGGAWGELVSGYVLGIRLVGPVRYALTIGDTRRVEQTQPIFSGSALGAYTTRGCLTGGPLTADWGPVKARGGWSYRVSKLAGDDVELRFVEGYGTGSDAPTVRDFRKVARPEIPDAVATYAQPNPYAIGGTSQFVTAYTTPVYDVATNDWVIGGGVVPLVGTTANNAAAVRALVVGFSTPQATEVLGVSPLYLYWPSCPHSNGDIIYVSLTTFDITERTPLYLDAHPVDVVTAIWTQARVRFNPAGAWIAAMKSLIGDNVRVALRLTEAPIIAPFLESAIFGPFGVAARTTTAGLQELFPTRIRTDVLPTVTLGAASLRDTDALVFDLDEATAVSSIELTQSVFAPAVYIEGAAATNGTTVAQSTAAPLDGVLVSTVSQTAQYADPGITVFAGRNVAYKLPGMIHTATDFAPNVGAQLGAIALAMFDRYGRGASVTNAPVLAGTAAAALQVGDEVYYEGPSFPNKGYRIGESTVGARIMQVVRRTDTPAGPLLKLSDSGLAAQPATAPTITIAKFTGSPTTTASFTITNAATLNASGAISVTVEYASGAIAPTGAAEFARYTSVSPNTIPTGAILLPPRTTAGQTMHVRARSEQAGLRPSAWTAWASVTLDAIPTITPFAIGTTTQTSAEISWTNTSSTLPIVVFAIASGSAPANWAPYRLASIPPGSTSTIVRTLTGPSVTWTIGVAYESAGILGPVTSASVTTNSTLGTTGRPAGLQVIAGLDDVTQTQGIALALWPADQTLDLVIQRSTTSGSGFAEIARVAGSTPTYVDERPRDGTTYYYRIAHELGGFGLSSFTQEVSAIAQGVGRDLVRPDAVTPVVSVETTEVATTATVLLTIADPQGRVTQVRFRERTGGGSFGAWTVVSPAPYTYSATIPNTGFVDIEYEVNGYTAAGVLGLLAGGIESFDRGGVANIVSASGSFSVAGALTIAVQADTDTDSFKYAVDTTAWVDDAAAFTAAQAGTLVNARNSLIQLTGPYTLGTTVYVAFAAYTGASGAGAVSGPYRYAFVNGANQGPSLSIETTPSTSSFSLYLVWDGVIAFTLDGATQSVAGWTSPRTEVINRNAVGGASKVASFSVAKNSATTSDSVTVPPEDPVSVKITSFTTAFDIPNNYIEYNYTLTGAPGTLGTDYNIETFALLNGTSQGALLSVTTTATQAVVVSPVTLTGSGDWELFFEVTDNASQVLATSRTVFATV
jgi:hypothetical protein